MEKKYSVRQLAVAGPFSGLEFGPTHPTSDFSLKITGSAHPVETIVSIDHLEFITRIDLPTTQLFVYCSSAVFDVGAEVRRNLNAAGRFSSLVPLIFFCGIARLLHGGRRWRASSSMIRIRSPVMLFQGRDAGPVYRRARLRGFHRVYPMELEANFPDGG